MSYAAKRAPESATAMAPAGVEPACETRCVRVVWARGACREGLGLEILHDLLRTRGVRQAAFASENNDLLFVDYDARNISTIEVLNAICRPGVWAKFVPG